MKARAYLPILLLAFALRVIFIFESSNTFIVWDASIYYQSSLQVQDALCSSLQYCTPIWEVSGTLQNSASAIYERPGLLSVILGAAFTVLPWHSIFNMALVINAMFDVLACAMVMSITWRISQRRWVAIAAGLLFAVYVPTITGTGAILQQPLIRLGLTTYLWGVVMAFETDRSRWVGIAMLGAFVVGFGSISTRPFLWVALATIIGLALTYRSFRTLMGGLTATWVILAVMIGILVISEPQDRIDAVMQITTGLSSGGETVSDQSTILSFENWWAPSSWQSLNVSQTESIFGDILGQPVEFSWALIHSIFGHFRYPDTAHYQAFVLTPFDQQVQHLFYLILGGIGLVALANDSRPRSRQLLVAALLGGGVILVIYCMIGIEPRRMTAYAPLMAVLAALGIQAFTRMSRWDVLLVAGAMLAWTIPVGLVPFLPPEGANLLLIALRTAAVMVVLWRLTSPPRLMPVGVIAGIGIVLLGGQIQEPDWREWQASVDDAVRQTITNVSQHETLHPWLIIDVDQPQVFTIRADDVQLKPVGQPMLEWNTGLPALWSSYGTIQQMANTPVTRRRWYAIAVPPHLLDDGSLTVDLINGEVEAAVVYGDYLREDATVTHGPSQSPWYDGDSFWRWQWNAHDPRIPVTTSLDGMAYESAWISGTDARTGDLSPAIGRQQGLYRIYLTFAPFGHATNAFGAPRAPDAATLCGEASLIVAPGNSDVVVCRNSDGDMIFTMNTTVIAGVSAEAFTQPFERYAVVAQSTTDAGRVDVIHVLNTLFVANLYTPDGTLIYSVVLDAGAA